MLIRHSPPIRMVGSKTDILSEVLRRFPPTRTFNRYFEPFLGGGAVLIRVLEMVRDGDLAIKQFFASDANHHIIALFIAIRDDPEKLMREVDKIMREGDDNEKKYYEVRDDFRKNGGTAKFLYLQKRCFRGLYRENSRGEFNASYGEFTGKIYDRANILGLSVLLQPVHLAPLDYSYIFELNLTSTDFVYLDPPYASTFNKYVGGTFDSTPLFSGLLKLHCPFLMSNSINPFPDKMYSDSVSKRRKIGKWVEAREFFVSNYPLPEKRDECVPFINKLVDALDSGSPSLKWLKDGRGFAVLDEALFTESILPSFFKSKTYNTFVIQTKMHGFEKHGYVFTHPDFFKDSPLLHNITRLKKKQTVGKSDSKLIPLIDKK